MPLRSKPSSSSPLPPSPAKLSPPRLANVLARPRLFRLLDRAARRPVIWVEGPAGSGKTTLAASWLTRRGGRSLWYQLDARDRDPATFFYYLREAARRLAPRRREPLPLLTPEHLAGVETFARNFFDGAFARLGAPGVLVLDDLQELPEGAALHRILPAVLGSIPDGVHVVMLSRTAPPPELARLRANSVVATLGWEALRFTQREAAALLAEHGLPRPRSGALAELCEEADGWAAGLVLLGEAARRGERWDLDDERRRAPELCDYFANELFDRAAPAVQRLLLATAPLRHVTAAIAERLGGEGAGERLERLARDNFFTTRRSTGDRVYEYHPLFRAFLRARAADALPLEERVRLQRRAADLLDEAGQPEEALALLQEVGDGAAARALVVRLAPALEAQGRLQTLEAWLRGLPEDAREGDPWVLHWLGVCRILSDPGESVALHERAFAAFQERGDDAGSLAAWAGAMKAIFFSWKRFRAARPWLRWLEARMRRTPELPSPELTASVGAIAVQSLLAGQPSHPDLPAWAARVAAILDRLDAPILRARAVVSIVWYRAWIGDVAALASAVEDMDRVCRTPGLPAATRIGCLGLAAVAAHHATCDPERSLEYAGEALRLAHREGIHAHDHWLHSTAAVALLSRGDAAGAGAHLDAIRRASGAAMVPYLQAAAWHALLLGDLDGALALATRALRVVEKGGFAMARPQVEYQLAQLHRVRGDAAGAERHLAAAEASAAAGRAAPVVWACRLMRAQLALDAGERDRGRALLREALADGREREFTNVPASSAALAFSGVGEEALEAEIEPEYVRRLIRLHELTPDPARAGAERWPFALRVTALGPFAVHRADGRALARGAGRSKPIELLEAVVALGGRDVPATRVVELLWPEAEGDRGRQRLRFTLHALRRLLGREDVLRFEKGLLSLDARRVRVDAWDLERQLVRLAAAVERRRREEAADALARAVALHRRPLLEDEAAPWAIAARERLEARLRRLALQAADALDGAEPAAVIPALELACERLRGEPRLEQALARARARARTTAGG